MNEKKQLPQETNDWFKPYNQPETIMSLCANYKVGYKTFIKWIKPLRGQIEFRRRRTFTPAELRMIIEFLGLYPD